jgi:DHA1 family multidrug resistance protein-like MFS transporter
MRGGRRSTWLVMGYGLSSSFASNLVGPFYSIFLFELARGSFLQTGLASQVPLAVSVVMGYLWARLSDRSGRRRVFVQLSAATGVAVNLALSYVESVEQLLVVQVAGAFLGSAGGAAFSALVAESFRERRGELLGRYSAFTVLGGFAGSLLSGFAYQHLGYRSALRLAALLNLIPLALISAVPEPGGGKPAEGRRRATRRIPRGFWRLFAARLLMSLPGAISSGVFAIYYLKYLGGSPESWSVVAAATTLLGLSSIPYGRLADRLPPRRMFTLAGLGWVVLYTGYYLSRSPLEFAAFFIIPVWPAFWLSYSKALMDLSDQAERAELFALESVLSSVYGSAVGIAAGYLADLLGPRELFLLSASAAAAATAIVQILLPDRAGKS